MRSRPPWYPPSPSPEEEGDSEKDSLEEESPDEDDTEEANVEKSENDDDGNDDDGGVAALVKSGGTTPRVIEVEKPSTDIFFPQTNIYFIHVFLGPCSQAVQLRSRSGDLP